MAALPRILAAQNSINAAIDRGRGTRRSFVDDFAALFHQSRTGTALPPTGRRHAAQKKKKRGRPIATYFLKVSVLNADYQKRPMSWKDLKDLKKIGLGNIDDGKLKVPASMSEDDFQKLLVSKCPNLQGKTLMFKKATTKGDLVDLHVSSKTPANIKQMIKKGTLFVVPSSMVEVTNQICSVCHCSVIGNTCLICEQNQEFHSSLSADREETRRKTRDINFRESRRIRIEAKPEPLDGFLLKIRMCDGRTATRKFLSSDFFSDLIDFIGSQDDSTKDFEVSVSGSSTSHHTSLTNSQQALKDLGIESQSVIYVTWLPDYSDLELEHTEEPNADFEEAGTPTVLFRRGSNSECVNEETLLETLTEGLNSEDDFESLSPIRIQGRGRRRIASRNYRSLQARSPSPPPTSPTPPPSSPTPPPSCPSTQAETQHMVIYIRRPFIVPDMLLAFRKEVIGKVRIELVNERAVDDGGVFRDVLSHFWDECLKIHFEGEDECVVVASPQLIPEDFVTLGKILVAGFEQVGFFPIRFCRVTLIAYIFGPEEVSQDLLYECFLKFLCNFEREILLEAFKCPILEGDLFDDVVEILARYRVTTRPTVSNLKACILRIAEIHLVENQTFSMQQMLPSLLKLKAHQAFASTAALLATFDNLKPTARKVLALLKANPKTIAEQTVFEYLRRFVRSLSDDMVATFLRFCSGSNMLTVPEIEVCFVQLTGLQRRFVVHTCGAMLEVPVSYASYNDFSYEFKSQLTGGFWEMQIL